MAKKIKPPTVDSLLHDAIVALLERVARPSDADPMTVNEQTAACKAGVTYVAMTHKIPDPNAEQGTFNGNSAAIQKLTAISRTGRNGARIEADDEA